MTMDDITNLDRFGEIAQAAAIQDCIGSFRRECMAPPSVVSGHCQVGTTYTEIDLSDHLGEISREKSAMLVMLLYPQASKAVDVKMYSPSTPSGYEIITYATGNVSTYGNPVSACWAVNLDTFNDAAKVYVKFSSAGYLKWHLWRMYCYTGFSKAEEGGV